MTLDEKIREIGVKRMLVVDDKIEHIEAAKQYFKDYSSVKVDYAQSAKEAISMIKDAYALQRYDIVLSDLEMEEKMSGVEVIAETAKYQGIGLIVTGRDGSGQHGPTTSLLISGEREGYFAGTKKETSVWQKVAEKASDYMCNEGKELYDSLKRYHDIHQKPSDEVIINLIKHSMEIEIMAKSR